MFREKSPSPESLEIHPEKGNSLAKRICRNIAIFGIDVLLFGLACYAAGARVNTSTSLLLGLYWKSNTPMEKGDYVLFCPPQQSVFDTAKTRGYIGAGFCPGGYGYMMKQVLAVNGDVISINDDGVRVNDELLPLSKPFKADDNGQPLPHVQYISTLGGSDVLLMSQVNQKSFDGRYFGPINRSQIKDVIRPILTW